MKKRIINLEINELSPSLLKNYLKIKKNSTLSKLKSKNLLKIYTTKANDVPKKQLYPSQTWASFSTGMPYSEHKCYRYSDPIDKSQLIWSKLTASEKNVGIVGSLHSSKIPNDLFSNHYYKFYLPDCFANNVVTKPLKYRDFQFFNITLVKGSARITGLINICKIITKNIFKIITFPKNFGISFFSLKMILKIVFFTIKNKNKELLRMAQFPLISSIFAEMFIKYSPDYAALFSNHIAGNMHRYWYAHDVKAFKNKDQYSKKWINRNRESINISIDLVDDFVGFILRKVQFQDSIILITSSMGQEANPEFDDKNLAQFDGKINNIESFLNHLKIYQRNNFDLNIEYNVERNMAPHYGFSIPNDKNLDLDKVSNSIESFVDSIGMKSELGRKGSSIVLTICPSTDINFQKNYNLITANKKYSKYGFLFFSVEDHHSGSHSPDGLLAVINPTSSFENNLKDCFDKEQCLDYLKVHNLIYEYF